ncbi:alkaline phosphatase family protein [candidate division KSB1 bacterium]|nr:alkaline phosphatase family protein [candidate division KSB1 bacterium]
MAKKVFVIGLDCATPQLVFGDWKNKLPNLHKLIEGGIYGELESTIPPITLPAWASMVTGKNPGRLGFYGFRNRKNFSYDDMFFANSYSVKEDTVWDILSRQGKKVIVMGVPPSYPPKPLNGIMIGCFLTPDTDSDYTYPSSLKDEIREKVGDYIIDVHDFRTEDKDYLLHQIYKMTEIRFKTVHYLVTAKEWDFFMFVEMGPDRVHHGLWKYMDREHIKYEPNSPYEHAIFDYYKYLDEEIGGLLALLDEDTVVLVVSDHGAKKMDGGICFNDWLIREGYLTLKTGVDEPTRFKNEMVDWGKSLAWGSGGYYGRLFLNVKGREPQGQIPPEHYEGVRDELIRKLEALTDHRGRPLGTKVFKPDDIYTEVRGIPPDLIVYFADLDWRSVGTVGNPGVWTFENDTGPDDANHAQQGIFILYDPRQKLGRRVSGLHVMDVMPTVLNLMGVDVPPNVEGKIVV